jgi:Na+/proline symporter
MYNGLLLYANYYNCDPLTAGLVKAKDQILPLFAMETLCGFPGLSGLFLSGVFSAALSSASTALNSMSAVVLEDFCGSMLNLKLSRKSSAIVVRGTVVVLGRFDQGII